MNNICIFQTAFDYLVHWSIMFSAVKEVFRIPENAMVYFSTDSISVCVSVSVALIYSIHNSFIT